MTYREEIDGLRGLALLAVILNHADFMLLRGGFFRVDIVFVISGCPTSRIVHGEIFEGRFSLGAFYGRRIRGILPALVVVVAVSIVGAYFTMVPDPFENFAQSVVATLLFANNVVLTLTSGHRGLPRTSNRCF